MGSGVLLGTSEGWADGGVWETGHGQAGTRHRGMKRHRYLRCGPQQPAGQPATLEVETNQAGGPIEVFENPLGGEVTATNCTLHGGRPTGIGPVTGQEQAIDRCPLRGPQSVHARSDGEGGPVLGHDPPPQQTGLSRSGQILARSMRTASRIASLSSGSRL